MRPERPDLRPERPDLRPEGLDEGGDGRTNEWTDERKSPYVLQDFVPFGAAARTVCSERPSGPLKTQLSRTRNAPKRLDDVLGVVFPLGPEPAKEDLESLPMSPLSGFIWIDWNPWQAHSLILISFILYMLF